MNWEDRLMQNHPWLVRPSKAARQTMPFLVLGWLIGTTIGAMTLPDRPPLVWIVAVLVQLAGLTLIVFGIYVLTMLLRYRQFKYRNKEK